MLQTKFHNESFKNKYCTVYKTSFHAVALETRQKYRNLTTNIRKLLQAYFYHVIHYKYSHRLTVLMTVSFMMLGLCACNQMPKAEAQKPDRSPVPGELRADPFVEKVLVSDSDSIRISLVNEYQLFTEGWDTLAQPQFWKQIMCLSPDSCILNVARTRMPLQTACFRTWVTQSEMEKSILKSRLRDQFCVDYGEEIYVTNGKREFYEHRKSIPTIAKAVQYFREFGTDPWYAQTILLIESPGKSHSKSYVGAAGPFQLMRSVALKYGLKVNKYVDERADLRRSAYGASRLLSTICIPKVKALLDVRAIPYKETDLWFRLLVLHAYHAGSGNVACVINKINPEAGGQQLIRTLWKTECGGFKNESQNYSQIALAALLNFEDMVELDGDTIFMIQGDKSYANARRAASLASPEDQKDNLMLALLMYERDLADGTISYDYFFERVNVLRSELALVDPQGGAKAYPMNEDQLVRLSHELLRKRKTDDAIRLLRFNMEQFPTSSVTAETLGKAYRMSGNAGLAQKYMTKSNELNASPR